MYILYKCNFHLYDGNMYVYDCGIQYEMEYKRIIFLIDGESEKDISVIYGM